MERINFAKPGVTVIVGHNGSGKTTIVECLKYATTGEQPPNTRGGAFVHDPKMANEKEVKAQVKLRFYARNGLRMTATRNLQVTAKKTGLTMKTLESLLDTENPKGGNKRTTISTRCAEIDAEIPNLLGVSKSVLENVIFCHQEDSYWPLAEPSVLKKKFDDIFEATKYTKALDNIKTIRKERVQDLKVEKERLLSLENDKKRAEKLNKQIADVSKVVDEKETTIEVLQEEETLITEENMRYYDQAMKFKETYMKAEELEGRNKHDKEDARALESSLGRERAPPSIADETLRQELDTFEASAKEKENVVKALQRQVQEGKDSETNLRRKFRDLESRRGVLQGDAQRHEENLAQRVATIQKLGQLHNVKISDGDDDDTVQNNMYAIKTLQKKQTGEVDEIQAKVVAKNGEYATKIADLRSQITSITRERDGAQSKISSLQSSIAQAEAVVDQNKALEADIKFNSDDLADKKARFSKMVEDFASAKYDDQILQKSKQISQAEGEREALHTEQNQSSMQANARAKLEVKKGEMKKKQSYVDRILETHNAKFQLYFQVDAQPESMESDIEQLLSVKSRELTRFETEYNRVNRESAEVHSSLERLKRELTTKRGDIEKVEKRLHEAVNLSNEPGVVVNTLDQALADAATEVKELQEEAGKIVGAGDFYKNLLEEGKKTKKCGVCERKLVSSKELDAFEQVLQEKIAATTETKIEENKAELELWTNELKRLQELLPMQADLNKLKTDVPKLEKTVEEQAKKDEVASAAAEKAASALKQAKTAISDLNTLREHARNVTRSNEEIASTRTEIAQLERDLQATGSSRTDSEINAEIDAVKTRIQNLNRERGLIQMQKDQQLAAQRSVESEMHGMEMKAGQLQARLTEGQNAEARMVQEKQELAEFRSKLPSLSTKISSLQSKIEELKTEQKEQERILVDQLSAAQERLTSLNTGILELDNIQSRIERYISEDRGQRLKDCTRQAAELDAQINKVVTALEAKRAELAAAQKEIDQGGARLSNLRDNLRLRRLRLRIEATTAELEGLPMAEAAESKQTFDRTWEARKNRENQIKAKISRLSGEVSTMKAQIDGFKKDLASDFKNITKRYMDQLVKVKMSDMANNDLEKYAKALDNAIMKYHSLKMEEVNDTMRHLWNKTYQGTDIDGIMIRSEGDGGTTRRSYNYRVVMTKDQVEMDMRGRCSAGQKMLASIIIRLALSDSFAQECGILALDEPTNALDVENIEALAASLVEIINERKRAANFQLIIITHDENFLRKLGENGVIQDYWRVTRSDQQKSIIEKHMLL